ncbi:MAG: DUF3828 domain-containing protein [Pseudomonadota bacterium]|jgi:hypothetical protein
MLKFFVLFCLLFVASANAQEELTAIQTIDNFYREYLDYKYDPTKPDIKAPNPIFSKSFNNALAESKSLCDKYANGEICGWAADSDPYLNAQDQEDNLTYEKANVKISEPIKGTIKVTFNLFPSGNNTVLNTVIYKVIKEDNIWVIDDLIDVADEPGIPYAEFSAKKQMEDEAKYLLGNKDK